MTQKDDDLRGSGKALIVARRELATARADVQAANLVLRDKRLALDAAQLAHETADDKVDDERGEPRNGNGNGNGNGGGSGNGNA